MNRAYIQLHDEFFQTLQDFKNPIAKDILANGIIDLDDKYINYLAISETNDGYISYLDKNRCEKLLSSDYWSPSKRYHGKPSSVIEKIFPKKYSDKEKEDFTVGFRNAVQKCCVDENLVRIVEGEEIRECYLDSNYYKTEEEEGGGLYQSCMKGEDQQDYLNIYVKNPNQIKLAVCFSAREKVRGRCILWYAEDGRILYDRIYATSNKLAKEIQACLDARGYVNICCKNPISEYDVKEKIVLDRVEFDYYPYMDSFMYMDVVGKAVMTDNRTEAKRLLRSTGGNYDKINYPMCGHCGRAHEEANLYEIIEGRYEGIRLGSCCAYNSAHHGGWIFHNNAVYIDRIQDWVLTDEARRLYNGQIEFISESVRLYDGEYASKHDAGLLQAYTGEYFIVGDSDFEEIDGVWKRVERIKGNKAKSTPESGYIPVEESSVWTRMSTVAGRHVYIWNDASGNGTYTYADNLDGRTIANVTPVEPVPSQGTPIPSDLIGIEQQAERMVEEQIATYDRYTMGQRNIRIVTDATGLEMFDTALREEANRMSVQISDRVDAMAEAPREPELRPGVDGEEFVLTLNGQDFPTNINQTNEEEQL